MDKRLLLVAALTLVLSQNTSAQSKAAATAAKKPPPPPDYFPLRQDDWWKYKSKTADGKESEYTLKVPKVEKKEDGTVIYWVDIISTTTIHDWYTKPKGLVLRIRQRYGENEQMNVNFDPPQQVIKNPLEKGDKWEWSGKGMMSVDIDDKSEVAPFVEEVIVPAGKFSTLKVTSTVVQGGSTATKTYWYAPWIGAVKQMTESGPVKTTSELMDYSFKKPPKK